MKKFFALSTLVAMLAGQLQAQECCTPPPACYQAQDCSPEQNYCPADCNAYCDGERASYMSALLPIGALVVAGVIIATTSDSHHGSSSSSKGHKRSSSSSSFHAHCS